MKLRIPESTFCQRTIFMSNSIIKKIIILFVVLVALALTLGMVAGKYRTSKPAVNIDTTDQPTMGNPNAKVHIVIFEDLKCISCRNFNNTVLPNIKKEYIDKGIAKYTVINLAFIQGSLPAANAARCLYKENPEWFFAFVNNIYLNQPPEREDWATIPRLVQFANVIPDLDTEKFSHCIYESPYTDFILNNFKIAQNLQGATVSTPAVYVNGRLVESPNFSNVKKAIESEK
jgi:protein-disulfide isomerase